LARESLHWSRHTRLHRLCGVALAPAIAVIGVLTISPIQSAAAVDTTPTSATWCTVHGSKVGGWTATAPALPICGPGPAYGGTWRWVNIPGPFGSLVSYFNATPGFQCVELAERFLSVVDGLKPVMANGAQVAMNYHSAYPSTTLVVNGSPGAVRNPPKPGSVISLSSSSGFGGNGHVAIVVKSHVDEGGDGTVTIAQQNVSASDYTYTLALSSWRLYDPQEPSNALFQFHYAEWLEVPSLRNAQAMRITLALAKRAPDATIVLSSVVRRAAIRHPHPTSRSRAVGHSHAVTRAVVVAKVGRTEAGARGAAKATVRKSRSRPARPRK